MKTFQESFLEGFYDTLEKNAGRTREEIYAARDAIRALKAKGTKNYVVKELTKVSPEVQRIADARTAAGRGSLGF